MELTIINQCDAWSSYSSFRLVGVFSNRKKLNETILKLIEDDSIEFEGSISEIEEMGLDELENNCRFINFNKITLNEDYS